MRWTKDLAERGGYHLGVLLISTRGRESAESVPLCAGRGDRSRTLDRAALPPCCSLGAGIRWAILDGYSVPTRYPNSLPESIPARVYAREAARLAEEIVTFVRHWLSENAPRASE